MLIILFILATMVSFVCSLLEAVILSTTAAYIEVGVQKGRRSSQLLQELKSQIDRPLAAILTMNTISTTAGAAFVGIEAAHEYSAAVAVSISMALTTVLLIVSEIIPKGLGASNWKALAPFSAYAIRVLIWLTYPFVLLSEQITKLFNHPQNPNLTREEMIMTAELGVSEGSIHKKESAVIKNLLMLDNIFVYDIMTPRSVLLAFQSELTVEEVMKNHKPIRFSRIPVYQEDLDHIIGMVHRYKIIEAAANDQDSLQIRQLATPLHSVSENISVAAALDLFIQRRDHIFLVTDDYGSTTGIVSLEDAIETLLGVEIVDEFDSVADMRQFALDQWKQRKERSDLQRARLVR